MFPEIIIAKDGSKTLFNKSLNETYHSIYGALQESQHVFIEAGFNFLYQQISSEPNRKISILDIGFGTGLNALLSYLEAERKGVQVDFYGIEMYPLPFVLINELNYQKTFTPEQQFAFRNMHESIWNEPILISRYFTLSKLENSILSFEPEPIYNLIYFDAFGPEKQPEMWTENVFKKMFDCLLPNGILVTYSAKGDVKRNLRAAGFEVCRLEGPPMKRHILRALRRK